MTGVYPTTLAIIRGLHREPPEGSPMQRGLTAQVHRLVENARLLDADDIAKAGTTGWDLGFRQSGDQYEIYARLRDDQQYEMLVTAMINRRRGDEWSYHWLVQGEHPVTAFSGKLYPNGAARSFADGISQARDRSLL